MKQTLYAPGLTLAQTFGYDKVNRLTLAVEKSGTASSVTCPDATAVWCQQFGYDQFGNRRLLPSQPSVFDAASNRFASGYTYKRGSVTRNPLNETFGYDAMDRQIAHCPAPGPEPCDATAAAGRNVYRYDAEGRRVRKSNGTTSWTIFVYDARGQLAAEDSTQAPAAGVQYLTQDHLGSTRVITRADGTVAERRDYEPFGADILVPGGSPRQGIGGYPGVGDVTLKFTGKERDAETGLDYFGARYYAGAQGRFTSADAPLVDQHAADPQSWSLYSYVRNNPLRFIDPTGRDCVNGVSSGYDDEALNGQACFTATATSDVPIRNPFFGAVAQGVNQAAPVVNTMAVATVAVPAAAFGIATLTAIVTPATVTTATAAGAAAGSPQGQQAIAGFLPEAQNGAQWIGPITSTVTENASVMFRVWGGASDRVGSWLTPSMPTSAGQAISNLSLPPGNAAQFVSEVLVPAGTRIQAGTAGPLFQHPGGGAQVLLLQYLPRGNFGPGVPLR